VSFDAAAVEEIFRRGVDSDLDGLPDEIEALIGTNPFDPDTDRDGFPDGLEIALGSNPLDAGSVPVIELPHEAFPQSFSVHNTAVSIVKDSVRKGEQTDVALEYSPRKRGAWIRAYSVVRHISDGLGRVWSTTDSSDFQQRFHRR